MTFSTPSRKAKPKAKALPLRLLADRPNQPLHLTAAA
jgi:hypothetical protein